jgi:hypothetical protein
MPAPCWIIVIFRCFVWALPLLKCATSRKQTIVDRWTGRWFENFSDHMRFQQHYDVLGKVEVLLVLSVMIEK